MLGSFLASYQVLLLPLFCGKKAKEQGTKFVLFKVLLASLVNIWLLFFLTVNPPEITQSPKSQSVSTGADISFSVEATGDNLQFQWQKDGADIDSNDPRFSSSQTYNISALQIQRVQKSDKGHYRCLVKNRVEKSGEISEEAELTVCKFVVLLLTIVDEFVYRELELIHPPLCTLPCMSLKELRKFVPQVMKIWVVTFERGYWFCVCRCSQSLS